MKYSIAMCNLNNFETIDESLGSILNQIDERFEVVIVDDGSTDGSLELLRDYEAKYNQVRVIRGDNNNLAEARNQSFRASDGDHVIESMDLDDRYDEGILDFVRIYERLIENMDQGIYLKGKSINIAPKELLIEYPYRSMGYGEDKDLWRRLFADNKIIWLEHKSFCETIREDYSKIEQMKNLYDMTVVRFRTGVTPLSFLLYCFSNLAKDTQVNLFRLLVWLPAYIRAKMRGIYDPPSDSFYTMGELEKSIANEKKTLKELQVEYNLSTDFLSKEGKEIFIYN